MNIVANTSAWPSLNSSASSTTTQAATGTDAAAAASTATATQVQGHHHHRHHEHHEEGEEHHGHHDQQAYMALQIKVEQTFSALTAPAGGTAAADGSTPAAAPAADGDDDDGAHLAASIKAKFSLSEGGMSASLSIRMSAEGQAGGDLASQMQGFVQTLYAALHTLFGGSQAAPNATLGTPVTTGAAAALTGATATPAASATTTPATTAPAAAETAADAQAPAASTDGAATTPPAASASPAASGSLSIKLRLTYNSFGSQLGSLTQQLAQPGTAQNTPGLPGLMDDMASRFGQMLSASGSNSNPSLGDFLSALAKAFSPQTGSTSTTAAAPADTAAAPAADGSTSPAEPAPAPAPAAYGQVLSFSASVRSQWLLAA